LKLNRALLKEAEDNGLIESKQAESLWHFLNERAKDVPSFRFTHVLYYFGGMIAIGAMSLFMTLGWERFGGLGLFCIATAYAGALLWLTERLLKQHLLIPAGITAALVVVLTPLAVYGLQRALGWRVEGRVFQEFNTRIDWHWLLMELATLASGALLLWRYRLPFLVMPIAVTLWYMSMDLTPFLFPNRWAMRELISLWFGFGMSVAAFWLDIRTRHVKDFSFWLYLFGVLTFWGGMTAMHSNSELSKFIYLCINLTMVVVGAVLGRRVFAVFGGFGAAGYLVHLAHDVFKNSTMFPVMLSLIGLAIVYGGILWQRHESSLSKRLRRWLPVSLRELLEQRH